MKKPVMKIKHTILRVIIAITQSKWLRPTLMVLVLVTSVLGATGCKPHH